MFEKILGDLSRVRSVEAERCRSGQVAARRRAVSARFGGCWCYLSTQSARFAIDDAPHRCTISR